VKVLITGGLGFIGITLARALAEPSNRLTLFDLAGEGEAAPPGAEVVLGDICSTDLVRQLVEEADLVFHLASVVSAGGERDFDLAVRVNLEGGRNVFEACRAAGTTPRLVFASTLAVFGGSAMPETVTDSTRPTPQTTYGATKAVCELLVSDYSRKGYFDGRTARLPTVVIRPGVPNEAASGFASAVFREPLAGRDYELPVSLETRMPVIGVRTAVDCLIRLSELPGEALGDDRTLNLPSVSVTVGEMVDALGRVAGARNLALGAIGVREDAAIGRIVRTWPRYSAAERAVEFGLPFDESLDPIVADFLDARG
jgi:nucleoside-diphosphate-sugar epimerase